MSSAKLGSSYHGPPHIIDFFCIRGSCDTFLEEMVMQGWLITQTQHVYICLPKEEGRLALPPISLMYKRLKVSQGALLLTAQDRITQHIILRTLQKEDTQVRVQFKPVGR